MPSLSSDERTPLIDSEQNRINGHIPNDDLSKTTDEQRTSDKSDSVNYSRVCQLLTAYVSFTVVGAYDGSYGPLNAPLRSHYDLSYLTVSFALLAPVFGYILAAFLNDHLHTTYGQRGTTLLLSTCHITAALVASRHPPYPVFVLTCLLSGLGNGIADASWNAWIGAMERSNGLMGLLHGFYGVGAALSPLGVAFIVDRAQLPWNQFYYLMLGASVLEFCTTVPAFWKETGTRYRETHPEHFESGQDSGIENGAANDNKESKNVLVEALKAPTTWLVCIFVFLYAGIEIGLADWVASFLTDERNFDSHTSSLITFGYWAGLTAGRTIVGFIASAMAPGKATVYICVTVTIAAWTVFCLVREIPAIGVTVAAFGFFLGPLFPEAVILQAKLLPPKLHLASIGFVCAFGSAGGGVFPFIIGALASASGIQILVPFIFAMLGGCLLCWWSLRSL